MVAPDVVKAEVVNTTTPGMAKVEVVAIRSRRVPAVGVAKAEVAASSPRRVPVAGEAIAANMAAPDMAKVKVVANKSRWVPGMDGIQTAHAVVATKTWLPLRSLWSRRGPNREATH